MPALLSTLRRVLPTIFGSINPSYNYNYNNTLLSGSNGIQKSVTHKVTFTGVRMMQSSWWIGARTTYRGNGREGENDQCRFSDELEYSYI